MSVCEVLPLFVWSYYWLSLSFELLKLEMPRPFKAESLKKLIAASNIWAQTLQKLILTRISRIQFRFVVRPLLPKLYRESLQKSFIWCQSDLIMLISVFTNWHFYPLTNISNIVKRQAITEPHRTEMGKTSLMCYGIRFGYRLEIQSSSCFQFCVLIILS